MDKDRRDTEGPKKEIEITAQFLRDGADHVATQFGTQVGLVKDLKAAANAIDEGDIAKAERILGVKISQKKIDAPYFPGQKPPDASHLIGELEEKGFDVTAEVGNKD